MLLHFAADVCLAGQGWKLLTSVPVQGCGRHGTQTQESCLENLVGIWDPEVTEDDAGTWTLVSSQQGDDFKVAYYYYKISAAVYESWPTPSSRQAFLQGCYLIGCTNMGGASEAALPTLLCSGYRQARYCSVGCQRAAWM